MKIVTVVGARPQFIKAAAVSRAIRTSQSPQLCEVLVHTGQHYDEKMSDVFFVELGIAPPAYNLAIAGGMHGAMTGRMMEALEPVLMKERPDCVLIYGDTNSTLAAALVASKLHFPIAHVEAGLRSFNMRMPEEVNRVLADRVSTTLLCPTDAAVRNLASEGITKNVHLVGDVMYDVALYFGKVAETNSTILSRLNISRGGFVLATCHRAENTDDANNLAEILRGLSVLTTDEHVVLPLHPRTLAKIREFGLEKLLEGITVTEPVSYLDMICLEKNARAIVTDSGGVQKEAFFYRVPCITTREQTEWVETVDSGWNVLVGANADAMITAVRESGSRRPSAIHPYGDGRAAEIIVQLLSRRS